MAKKKSAQKGAKDPGTEIADFDTKVERGKKLGEEEEKLWAKFLKPAKVIRDAVHGDVWLTDIETEIIREIYFQRLRYIRQLSSSHLIYPSANHTRFEHSIGVLHISQQIIESVERNFEYKKRVIDQRDEHILSTGINCAFLSKVLEQIYIESATF